jgi:hypothetical protein
MDAPTESQLMPVKKAPVESLPARLEGEAGVLPGSPRDLIYRAYMEGDGSQGPAELAAQYDRPLLEVLQWFKDGGWVRTRRELTGAFKDHNDQVFREFMHNGRLQAAQQQAATGAALEGLVNQMIEDAKHGRLKNSKGENMGLSPNVLKTITEGASTAAALRARIFGLSEQAAAAAAAAAAAEVPQRLGLIVLDRSGQSGPVVPQQSSQVINVAPSEIGPATATQPKPQGG